MIKKTVQYQWWKYRRCGLSRQNGNPTINQRVICRPRVCKLVHSAVTVFDVQPDHIILTGQLKPEVMLKVPKSTLDEHI